MPEVQGHPSVGDTRARTTEVDLPTIPDDLVAMLDLLCQTIVAALGFGVAVVNIMRPDGSLLVVSVAGDDQAREALLGTSQGADVWDRMLVSSEHWGRLRFLDHRAYSDNDDDGESADELMTWIPDVEPVDHEDAWHPEDALFAPLTAADGSRLGVLSVDLPRGGMRPNPTIRSALEAFAISSALAIEHSTLRTRAEASERRFRDIAAHDPLTGIGNRSMLLARLEHALSVRPDGGSRLALMFLDLDGFKPINDRHSHATGDHVLKTVAERIRAVVRPHDTVARWGGDEFLVLLEGLADDHAALAVVRRVIAVVAEPIQHLGEEVAVTTSVGVALWTAGDDVGTDEVIRHADAAMYQVKGCGGNAFAVCNLPSPQDDPRPDEGAVSPSGRER